MDFYTEEDYINITDDVLEDAYKVYSKLGAVYSDMTNDINNAGEINKEADLFGDAMNKMGTQSNAISTRCNSISHIISESIDEWNLLEKELLNKSNSIIIPKIEGLNDSVVNYSYNNVNLLKNDGKSVNFGNTVDFYLKENQSTINNQDLNNINNLNNTELKELSNNTSIEKENLNNINNEFNSKLQELNDYKVDKKNLIDINNSNNTELQELSNNTSIKKEQLYNINNEYKDGLRKLNDYRVEKENLYNINNKSE